MFQQTSFNGYIESAKTVCELNLFEDLEKIEIPMKVICGNQDLATPQDWGIKTAPTH